MNKVAKPTNRDLSFCRLDGREFADCSRLGTRQAQTKRTRCGFVADCRAKARSVHATVISLDNSPLPAGEGSGVRSNRKMDG